MATFKPKQFIKQIDSIAHNFTTAMKDELMDMGLAAEKHFDKSFEDEGFTDTKLEKWVPLSRRRLNEKPAGNKILTDRGELRASKKLINSGNTGSLLASISYGGVGWSSVRSSARNNHGFVNGEGNSVPKRQFIGKSYVLNMKMLRMLEERIERVFKTNYTTGR